MISRFDTFMMNNILLLHLLANIQNYNIFSNCISQKAIKAWIIANCIDFIPIYHLFRLEMVILYNIEFFLRTLYKILEVFIISWTPFIIFHLFNDSGFSSDTFLIACSKNNSVIWAAVLHNLNFWKILRVGGEIVVQPGGPEPGGDPHTLH